MTRFWGVLALALGLTASGSAAAQEADLLTTGRVVDGIVAVVDEDAITRFELDRASAPFLAKALSEGEEAEAALPRIRIEVLDGLVEDLLIQREAKRLQLEISDTQVEAQLTRVKENNQWTDEQLTAAVRQSGFPSLNAYRDHVGRELMKTQAVSIRVASRIQIDEAEVARVYETEYGNGTAVIERHALHILIRLNALAGPDEIAAAKAALRDVRAQVADGTLSFEEAARRTSQDANAAAGGDLGWFARGDYVPEFEKAAYALGINEVSPPVRTPFGLHLIKIIGERTRDTTTDASREDIKRQIRYRLRERELSRLYDQWVKGLRTQAFVQIRDKRMGTTTP